jgi:hypothetical protein
MKTDLDKSDAKCAREPNAWVIRVNDEPRDYTVVIPVAPSIAKALAAGDGVVLVSEEDGRVLVHSFARIYRIRFGLKTTTLHFDSVIPLAPPVEAASLGLPQPTGAIHRIDWPTFSAALKKATGKEFDEMSLLEGKTAKEQAYVRQLLQLAVMDDLLGPATGPEEEVVGMSVRDRYLVGKLAPKDTHLEADQEDELGGGDDDDDGVKEVDASRTQSLVPSSFGLTFCISGEVEQIEIEVAWGRYERRDSETAPQKESGKPMRAWKRIPSGGKATVTLKDGALGPLALDANCPDVVIQGTVRPRLASGDRLVTVFLLNNQTKPEENQDTAWVFQPEIILRGPEGQPVFRRRPVIDVNDGDDPDLQERVALEMVYRKRVEFAVGHGMAVHATTAPDNVEQASEIRTTVMPDYEVQVTETPGLEPEDRPAMQRLVQEGFLDMTQLANLSREDLLAALGILTNDYAAWIAMQQARHTPDVIRYATAANEAMGRCENILARLREGIGVLGTNDDALEAFRFANRAMANQRIRSMYSLKRRRGEAVELADLDIPKNRSWRPFQLAFVLLSIPALADPTHTDRTEPLQSYADLLWFPTGGGKTEAYLGVAAFTMGIRRLQGNMGGYDGSRGLAVIMRYTLRLLTIQQFQRATALICAMEELRRADTGKWGTERFTLGLWVGNKVTPGTTEASHAAIVAVKDGKMSSSATPAQLTFCPWCGSEIHPGRDVYVDKAEGRTALCCGDKFSQCEFSKAKSGGLGLPVVVVDEEIYHRPPTMMIGTVDKFAMMAWRGQVRTLFGKASQECLRHGLLWPDAPCTGNHNASGGHPKVSARAVHNIRPPDLIIQDEFHLISGPLGTMVGLYETAVDEMSAWTLDGKTVRPKVIASTATVRKAKEQVNNVFLRKVAVFPPHGLDIEDNFFSVQRSVADKPGRLYVGVCSPGSSRPAVLIRLYSALLTAAQSLYDRFGQAADPYMTVVGYFNSLRELGGMRRLAEDDVQTRAYRVQMSTVARPGLSQRAVKVVEELTSRVSSRDIPKKLDQLEVVFKKTWNKDDTRAIDVVLATNMLSVGVDVNRIGLMAVNGQPKSTAEYIQATSRVGRAFPGIVFTVLTWSRPRDLSHYESFEHYHATFYKHVEAQSVTPFAPRAMDRGLTGTMVSLLRLSEEGMNPNPGAATLNSSVNAEAANVKDLISDRAWKVTHKSGVKTAAATMLSSRIDQWVKEATRPGRILGYETGKGQGNVVGLLKKPGIHRWDNFTVPMSMREVEAGVNLVMETTDLDSGPKWKAQPEPDQKHA